MSFENAKKCYKAHSDELNKIACWAQRKYKKKLEQYDSEARVRVFKVLPKIFLKYVLVLFSIYYIFKFLFPIQSKN